jgi:hypothetical protein
MGPALAPYCGVTVDPSGTDESAPFDVARVPERRWPMALATLTAAGLHQLLPDDFRPSPHWLYPAAMAVFLILLIAGDPGLINRERRWLRVTTGLMIALIALTNLFSAYRLVDGILTSANFTDSPYQLLAIGAIVWSTNVIAFALWFWDVDGGGAAPRAARGAWADPAFVFPEMGLLDHVGPGWYPQFADYLALSFNTATAFSPTDVSAIKRWAKLLMILESSASLVLATLVVAKAINSLTGP